MYGENGPMMSVCDVPVTCDVCDVPQQDGEAGEDWNGETGCHRSCEAGQRFDEIMRERHTHDEEVNAFLGLAYGG